MFSSSNTEPDCFSPIILMFTSVSVCLDLLFRWVKSGLTASKPCHATSFFVFISSPSFFIYFIITQKAHDAGSAFFMLKNKSIERSSGRKEGRGWGGRGGHTLWLGKSREWQKPGWHASSRQTGRLVGRSRNAAFSMIRISTFCVL